MHRVSSFVSTIAFGALFSALVAAGASAQASLTSDAPDYAPGTIAVLTGAGFAPNESVAMQVLHADGDPATGADHDPWFVDADDQGGFVTTWHVCEDDCVGELLLATADQVSGAHAETTFTDGPCGSGDGMVTVTPLGGSCVAGTLPSGNGPYNWEVVQGGTYTMTIVGITECTDSTITVFVQGSTTGNFCFNATGGSGTYSGTFTMPNPACFTYPISYKCGANADCDNVGAIGARGPNGECTVHLRAATFSSTCELTGEDKDCSGGGCCTPIITCPGDMTVECTGDTSPAATGLATVGTGCAATITSSDSFVPACGNTGVISRTWTATSNDACQLTATCVQTITVVDTTDPSISCPLDATVECTGDTSPAATGRATGSDTCGNVKITSSDSFAPACGNTGVITRTWTAEDDCGNTASCEQTITVVDTTGPSIICPLDATVECTGDTSPAATGMATGSDTCGNVKITSSDSFEPACGNTGVITRTWTAEDDCGNTTSCDQTITVVDTTDPSISCPPNVTQPGNGSCCIPVTLGEPSASDSCGNVNVTNDAKPPFCVGTTTVTWTATDDCLNQATCQQTVTVLGQICATKFYDANANGTFDDGEQGIGAWPIVVSGDGSFIGATDSFGTVCFDVPAGSYTVTEGTPTQANWVHTTPASVAVTVDDSKCSASVEFGNYCFNAPSGGLTLGFWSNKNGQKILQENDPAWRTVLAGLNLRNANGTPFILPAGSFATAYNAFKNWLLKATATNMAYMLSAQLAATTLDVNFGTLNDGYGVIVPGGVKTLANVCIVPFLSVCQTITCGDPPLLALTACPGSTACGCNSNDGLVTVGALRARAVCLLGAYASTPGMAVGGAGSTPRTYQECVKDILDMINNNGNPSGSSAYPCGPLTQYINPDPGSCPADF